MNPPRDNDDTEREYSGADEGLPLPPADKEKPDTRSDQRSPVIVGLYMSPWADSDSKPGIATRVRNHYCALAAPRDTDYMRAHFQERFPEGDFVEVTKHSHWRQLAAGASSVVFLYPDAIGQGFGSLESEVRKLTKPWCNVKALNGRQRLMVLDGGTRRALFIRRWVEKLLIGEILFALVFLVGTPIFWIYDLLQGKR